MRRSFWKMPATIEIGLGNDKNDTVKKLALIAGIGAAAAGLFAYLKKNPKKCNKLIDGLPMDKKAKKEAKKKLTKASRQEKKSNKKATKYAKKSTVKFKKMLKKKKLL